MTTTIIGQVVTPEGLIQSANALGDIDRVAWVGAGQFVSDQLANLPIHFEHDETWTLGHVGYLERSDRLGLMAVAVIDADVGDLLAEHRWYFSDSITCRRVGQELRRADARLRELSLVSKTANCGTRPVIAVPGDLSRGTSSQPRTMPWTWDDTWTRAAAHIERARYRSSARSLTIYDVDAPIHTRAAVPAATTPPGPTVNWYGQELGGEVAQKVLDAIHDDGLGVLA